MFFILIIMGLIPVFFPKRIIEFKMGFHTNDDPEPSTLAILLTRISGFIILIFAIFTLFD